MPNTITLLVLNFDPGALFRYFPTLALNGEFAQSSSLSLSICTKENCKFIVKFEKCHNWFMLESTPIPILTNIERCVNFLATMYPYYCTNLYRVCASFYMNLQVKSVE